MIECPTCKLMDRKACQLVECPSPTVLLERAKYGEAVNAMLLEGFPEMITWRDRLRNLYSALGREPTLEEMLTAAEVHVMTPEELQEQAESFARAMRPTGDPRFD